MVLGASFGARGSYLTSIYVAFGALFGARGPYLTNVCVVSCLKIRLWLLLLLLLLTLSKHLYMMYLQF